MGCGRWGRPLHVAVGCNFAVTTRPVHTRLAISKESWSHLIKFQSWLRGTVQEPFHGTKRRGETTQERRERPRTDQALTLARKRVASAAGATWRNCERSEVYCEREGRKAGEP